MGKNKCRELLALVVGEEKLENHNRNVDPESDPRLARRFNRRLVAHQNFSRISSGICGANRSIKAVEKNPEMDLIVLSDDEVTPDWGKVLDGKAVGLYSDIGDGTYDPGSENDCNVDANDVNRGVVNGTNSDANNAVVVVEDDSTGNLAVDCGNVNARSVDGDEVSDGNICVPLDVDSLTAVTVNDGSSGDAEPVSNNIVDLTSPENVNAFGGLSNNDVVLLSGMLNNCNLDARFGNNDGVGLSLDNDDNDIVGDGGLCAVNDVDARHVDDGNGDYVNYGGNSDADDNHDTDPDYEEFLNKFNIECYSFDEGLCAVNDVDARHVDDDNGDYVTYGGNSDADDNRDTDPDYEEFLNKFNIECYSFDYTTNDGKTIIVRYEIDDDGPSTDDGSNTKTQETERDCQFLNCSRRKGMRFQSELTRDNSKSRKRMRSVPCSGKRSSMVNRKVQKVSADPISCRSNQHASKRGRRKMINSNKCDYKGDTKSDEVDPHYALYLKMEFCKSDKQNSFKDDERSSSDVQVLNINAYSNGDNTPFVTSKAYESCDEENGGHFQSCGRNQYSKFREGLLEILKKPYDEKEYNDLLTEAKQRKPVERERNLRGRIKRYPTETTGKSYLDLYNDLAMKIEAAKNDRPKVLNLLRGFFYWLQNIAHAVFQPWLDESIF